MLTGAGESALARRVVTGITIGYGDERGTGRGRGRLLLTGQCVPTPCVRFGHRRRVGRLWRVLLSSGFSAPTKSPPVELKRSGAHLLPHPQFEVRRAPASGNRLKRNCAAQAEHLFSLQQLAFMAPLQATNPNSSPAPSGHEAPTNARPAVGRPQFERTDNSNPSGPERVVAEPRASRSTTDGGCFDVHSFVDSVSDESIDEADVEMLMAMSSGFVRLDGWQTVKRARIAACLQRLHATEGSPDARTVLGRHPHVDDRQAKRTARHGAIVDAVPTLGAAVSDGDLSVGHLDAAARIADWLDRQHRAMLIDALPDVIEDTAGASVGMFTERLRELVRQQSSTPPVDALEAERAKNTCRTWTDQDGRTRLEASFDPVTGRRVVTALERAVTRIVNTQRDERHRLPAGQRWFPDRIRAEVLADLVSGESSTDAKSGKATEPDIVVFCSPESLRDPERSPGVTPDGFAVPTETLDRLLCEARLHAYEVGPHGDVLRKGATLATASNEQRRALFSMYASCAYPGCDVPVAQCHIHHVIFRRHQGKTLIENLLPLCSRHHHRVHEGGERLTMHPVTRHLAIHYRDGTVIRHRFIGHPHRPRSSPTRPADGSTQQIRAG
jgi:hypothetical protein